MQLTNVLIQFLLLLLIWPSPSTVLMLAACSIATPAVLMCSSHSPLIYSCFNFSQTSSIFSQDFFTWSYIMPLPSSIPAVFQWQMVLPYLTGVPLYSGTRHLTAAVDHSVDQCQKGTQKTFFLVTPSEKGKTNSLSCSCGHLTLPRAFRHFPSVLQIILAQSSLFCSVGSLSQSLGN